MQRRKLWRIKARAVEAIGWTARKAAEGLGSTIGAEVGRWIIQAVSGAAGGMMSGWFARWLFWRDGP